MPTSKQWPYEFTSFDMGVTQFAPVDVTVKKLVLRKANQSVWGWKFEEDTTKLPGEFPDVVWGAPQEYDHASGKYQAYKGPRYGPGTRMTVELAMTEKGEETYFNIRKITLAPEVAGGAANEQPESNARPPGAISDSDAVPPEWSLPREYWEKRQALERRSIQMQTAFNGLVSLLNNPQVDIIWTFKNEVARMKYQVRTLVLMLVPGLPESEGAQAARTNAEEGWTDADMADRPAAPATKPAQTEMPTGAETKRAVH